MTKLGNTFPPRNQTTLKPSDHIPEENFKKGKPKLKVKQVKSSEGCIPEEVVKFIQEFLENSGLVPEVNMSLNGAVYPYYFPEQKAVLDWLREETPDELERRVVNREQCKKLGILRIPISKFKFKNQLNQLL